MYKLIAAFILLSIPFGIAKVAAADDICFIGSPSPLTGRPGATFPVTPANQPVLDEANTIKSAFDVDAPLYQSAYLDDFSDKLGFVYLGRPLVTYLQTENGADTKYDGLGLFLAHEYAHQFQFKIWASGHDVQPKSIALIEIEADVIAGVWEGINDRQFLNNLRSRVGPSFDRNVGINDIEGKELHVADQTADFLGWTPGVHGTTSQREAAIKAGIEYGEDFYQAFPNTAFKSYAYQIYDFSKATAADVLAN